jgi:RNA polymerase sigma-70 factor (ECF subfamily)
MKMKKENFNYKNNFAACYKKFASKLSSFIFKRIYDREAASEITNDIFLKLYKKECQLDPDNPATLTYLCKIARNQIIDLYRKEKRTNVRNLTSIEEITLSDKNSKNLDDLVIEGEVIETLHQIIDSFPQKEKKLYLKKQFEKIRFKDICSEISISYYKAQKVLKKIDKKIKEDLANYFTPN